MDGWMDDSPLEIFSSSSSSICLGNIFENEEEEDE
jgi:hypothetical protein